MFYKLKDRFVLRGWERLPYAIQDTQTGNTSFIDDITFQAVSFCDGQIDTASPLILPLHKDIIRDLKEKGIVIECCYGDELKKDQKYRLIPCRYISRAHWSITGKCNLRCRHCFMSAPQAKYGELSHSQCMDIVQQLSDASIGKVSLTGGEPLVRNDFLKIVDALSDKNIVISQIYTNGVLVNEHLLSELEKRKIKPEFNLSFDGLGCHDWMRGVDGAEKKALDAIKLLRAHGFEVGIETAIHKGNIEALESTLYLLAELGVQNWKATPASDAGEWLKEEGQFNLDIPELYEVYLDFIQKYRSAGAPINVMLGGFFYCRKGSNNYRIPLKKYNGTEKMLKQTVCASARNTMYIGADGKLLPCIPLTGMPIREEMPNVIEIGLLKALSDSTYLSRIDTRLVDLLAVNEKCNACDYKLYCGGGCRAGALMVTNDYLGYDEYTCYFFTNNYEDKIKQIYQE